MDVRLRRRDTGDTGDTHTNTVRLTKERNPMSDKSCQFTEEAGEQEEERVGKEEI